MSSESDSPTPANNKRLHTESPLKEEKDLKVQKVSPGNVSMAELAVLTTELKRMSNKMDQQTERLEDALGRVKTEISGEIGRLSESVGRLNTQVELQAKEIKSVKTHVGLLQKAVSDDRGRISTLESKVETLARKAVDMEDRSRRNNVRLVGLAEGAEGSDAVGFLRINLSIWFPSMKDRLIEVDRAHRVYGAGAQNTGRSRTLIFRLLRWQDRDAILTAAKKRVPPIRHGNSNLLFFADYSTATTAKRKTFSSAMRLAHDKDLRPFLIYPATLKLRLGSGPKLFDDAASALVFIHQQPPASDATGNATERREKARRNLFTGGSRAAAPESGQIQEMDVHGEDVAVDQ